MLFDPPASPSSASSPPSSSLLFRLGSDERSGAGAGGVGLCHRARRLHHRARLPILGAVADAGGRRKPWIAICGLMLAAGSAALWFAAPGDESRVPFILLAFVLATVGAECAITFNNAMMPGLVPPDGWAASRASAGRRAMWAASSRWRSFSSSSPPAGHRPDARRPPARAGARCRRP